MKLTHKLEVLFPEEREVLRGVEGRLARVGASEQKRVGMDDGVAGAGMDKIKRNKRKWGRREDDRV